jgi:hypothetical protein
MMVPCCRVYSVGEVSAWASQFLGTLRAANVIEVAAEPSVEAFCRPTHGDASVPIAFIENCPDSRRWIQAIRDGGRRCFLVWYGRGFTKEDLHFAIEQKVYRIFENARAEDKAVEAEIRKIAAAADLQHQTEQILQSIKSTLLQDGAKSPVIEEIKAAVSKIERGVMSNEFQAKVDPHGLTAESKIPFYKEQDFGDALSTVHDLERTGVLSVRGSLPGQEGHVEFLQGKLVGAVTGQVRGLKAIYRMFLWDQPKFVFSKVSPDDLDVEEHLNYSMKFIRAEGEALKARFTQIRRELPPGELKLELEPNALHGGVKLNPDDFSTLSSVVEFGDVARVLDYNPLPDVSVLESLIRLKRNQMIRVFMAPARSAA